MASRTVSLLFAIAFISASAFDAQSQRLKPQSPAKLEGEQVTIEASEPRGAFDFWRRVSGLWLKITNHSDRALKLDLSRFYLLDSEQRAYSAIEPERAISMSYPGGRKIFGDTAALHREVIGSMTLPPHAAREGVLFFESIPKDALKKPLKLQLTGVYDQDVFLVSK